MSDTTISIGVPGGEMTPPVSLDVFKAAVDQVKGGPKMKPDAEFDEAADKAYSITARELRAFVERYERLQSEKDDLTSEQSEVMSEAKGRGYDVKVLKKVIALRKREPADVAEEEAIVQLYREALGV